MADEAETKPTTAPRDLRVAAFLMQTADAAEKMTNACFGAVRGAAGTLSARVVRLIDVVEGGQPALFKRMRAANERAAKMSEALIATVEKLALDVVRAVRDNGRDVAKAAGASDVAQAA